MEKLKNKKWYYKLYFQEKSFLFYSLGTIIFLLYFIYVLFNRNILLEKNTFTLLLSLSTFSLFFIGFFIDSTKLIKKIWSNFYGKILHFIIALCVYAFSYSFAEKIIFINTQLDANLLQSSIHLFVALFNLPIWLLTFQIFLLLYTIFYFLTFLFIVFIYYSLLILKNFTLELLKIFRDLIPKNLLYKNKYIRVKLKVIKKKIKIKKRLLILKAIHSFFFILGGIAFMTFLPMDKLVLNSKILKENELIKKIIVFTSFYEANNKICKNINSNYIRLYGNKFSKAEIINNKLIFTNHIQCKK